MPRRWACARLHRGDSECHHLESAHPVRANRDIVAAEIGYEEKVVLDDALRPEASFDQFKALLNRHKDKIAIMVVGHDPSMTEFVNRVLTGGTPMALIEMKKGGVAKVEKELRRPAVLRWLITPKLVQRTQRSAEKRSRPKTELK